MRGLIRGVLKECIEEQKLEEDNLVSQEELEKSDEEIIDENWAEAKPIGLDSNFDNGYVKSSTKEL